MTPLGYPTLSQCPLGGSARLSLQPLSEELRICCETVELLTPIQPFDPSRTAGDVHSLTAFAGNSGPGRQPGGESHATLDDPLLA